MRSGIVYRRGDLVLVPFPFTDLTTIKRRPAIIVSPDQFHQKSEDLVLVAVTSQRSSVLSEWEVALEQSDLVKGRLPKPSVIKLTKIFTCHRSLLVKAVGKLKPETLKHALTLIRRFFMESAS